MLVFVFIIWIYIFLGCIILVMIILNWFRFGIIIGSIELLVLFWFWVRLSWIIFFLIDFFGCSLGFILNSFILREFFFVLLIFVKKGLGIWDVKCFFKNVIVLLD